MHDGANTTGIYNDVSNEWLFRASHNGGSAMYDNGLWKIRTETNGATVNGKIRMLSQTVSGDSNNTVATK
jgi:hypothetical protein